MFKYCSNAKVITLQLVQSLSLHQNICKNVRQYYTLPHKNVQLFDPMHTPGALYLMECKQDFDKSLLFHILMQMLRTVHIETA